MGVWLLPASPLAKAQTCSHQQRAHGRLRTGLRPCRSWRTGRAAAVAAASHCGFCTCCCPLRLLQGRLHLLKRLLAQLPPGLGLLLHPLYVTKHAMCNL